MTDAPPVAELDAPSPAAAKEKRLLPYLWTAVTLLLISAIAAALLGVGRDDKSPAERVAAAGGQAEAQDHAFEVTLEASASSPIPSAFTFNGVVDVETSRTSAEGRLATPAFTMEFLTDGKFQYLKLPAGLGAADKPWIRFDTTGLGSSQPTTGANPLDALRQLDAVVGEVKRVGQEDVRGEPTVHLRFVVDAIRANPEAAEKLPDDVRERLRRVPMELWLDEDDRPRRIRQVVDLGAAAGGKVTTTVELFDFGKPVAIDLPPADQVQDVDLNDPAAVGALFGGATPTD